MRASAAAAAGSVAALSTGTLLVLAAGAPSPVPAAARHPASAIDTPAAPSSAHLWLEMRNVDLHIDERSVLHVRRLRGEAVSTTPGAPAVLDDATSFSVRVTGGTVALDGDGVAALLNDYAFAYRRAPLRHLRVRVAAPYLVQRGVLHKGIDLPFEITATPSLEPDGRVRLRPIRTRILGLDGAKLLHALGLRLDKLMDLRGARGVSLEGNDFLLEPAAIIPPPTLTGRLASIRVDGDQIVQDFVRLPDDSVFDGFARPDSAARNYVNFRGARLRFGKLLMTDTNLQIVDADERDPFDLYLAQYTRQLVAGTSRTLDNLGLRVLMPDWHTVAHPTAPGPTLP